MCGSWCRYRRAGRLAQADISRFGAEGRTVLRDQAVKDTIFGYLADMLRPHGVPFDEARFLAGHQNSYAFLASQCLAAMRTEAEPDLVVLAHATADCESSRSLSGYLSTLFRGEPLCFAISDQGDLSPFTALQVLRGYGATSRRALVMILDQSTLAYARAPDPGPGASETDHVLGCSSSPGPVRLDGRWPPYGTGRRSRRTTLARPSPRSRRPSRPRRRSRGRARSRWSPGSTSRPRSWLRCYGKPGKAGGGPCRTPPGPGCVAPWAGGGGGGLGGLGDSTAGRVLVIGYDQSLALLSAALFDPVTLG